LEIKKKQPENLAEKKQTNEISGQKDNSKIEKGSFAKMSQRFFRSRIGNALIPRLRELRFSLYLMSKSATSIAGLVIIGILVIVAAFPSIFAPPYNPLNPFQMPFDPTKGDPPGAPIPPGTDGYIFGTGEYGADIYYGIIWGAQISMVFSIEIIAISIAIGLVLGLLAGYKGGAIDEIVMRLTDVFLSVPSLVLVMAIAAVLGRNLESTKLALIMVWWSGYTRVIRGQVLSIRENAYVDAARAAGASETRIMFRHILPNSWAPMIVQATMDMGSVVLVMAGLSYLGLGAEDGTTEWGKMIQEGQNYFIAGDWWMVLFPGLAILFFVLAFNLVGDGLRDILDPKMRR